MAVAASIPTSPSSHSTPSAPSVAVSSTAVAAASTKLDEVAEEAVALFYASFARFRDLPRAALTIATAPGRVNLIGEHTDYNDGFVLPLALDKNTVIVGIATPLDGEDEDANVSHIVSAKFPGEVVKFPANDVAKIVPGLPAWGNYVRGVTAMYLRHTGREAMSVRAAIVSRVPFGSGLSSSAALEVSFATFLESVFAIPDMTLTQKALLCQKAEHEYCNVPCGIMDQFISSCGKGNCALLIDCRTKEATPVPFEDPNVVIVVSNSNVNHELSGGEYKERVQQCRTAVAALQTLYPEITHLRDATMPQLDAVKGQLEDVVYCRARHVITENERTVQTVALVNARKYAEAGELMFASHKSLKDDYEVSTPQLDTLVEIARQSPGVFGARMTGGGFGGCIIVLLRRENAAQLLDKLDEGYPKHIFGDHEFPKPTSFITHIGHGAQVLQVGEPQIAK
ncbi:Galactokinase [Globisporangium polare]